LKGALEELEVAMAQMAKFGEKGPTGLDELGSVSTTHVAIHGHSRPKPHPKWVWMPKSSAVDQEGILEFPASVDDIRKYGARARKVFIQPPPSKHLESFTEIL
jgi:hypothetical protein